MTYRLVGGGQPVPIQLLKFFVHPQPPLPLFPASRRFLSFLHGPSKRYTKLPQLHYISTVLQTAANIMIAYFQ
jgi:hypothetical protein